MHACFFLVLTSVMVYDNIVYVGALFQKTVMCAERFPNAAFAAED